MIGFAFFIVSIIAYKFMTERALKNLSDTDKVKLVDAFSTYRKFGLLAVLSFCAIAFFLSTYIEAALDKSFYLFYILLSFFMGGYYLLIYKKLKNIEISQSYLKIYLIASTILGLGVLSLVLF